MFPDLRFVVGAVVCSILLLVGSVTLLASRIATGSIGQHGLREHAPLLALADAKRPLDLRPLQVRDDDAPMVALQFGPVQARAETMPPEEIPERRFDAALRRIAPSPLAVASGDPAPLQHLQLASAAPEAPPALMPAALAPRETRLPVRLRGREIVAETVTPPMVMFASLSGSATPWIRADLELAVTIPLPQPDPAPTPPAQEMVVAPAPAAMAAVQPAAAPEELIPAAAPARVPFPRRRSAGAHRSRPAPAPARAAPVVRHTARRPAPARPQPHARRAAAKKAPAATDPTQAYWQQQQRWWNAQQQQQQRTQARRQKRAGFGF